MPPSSKRFHPLLLYAALVAVSAGMAMPFFWMVMTSLKPPEEVLAYPPSWWPSELVWGNYTAAWRAAPFDAFLFNSVVTATLATLIQLVAAALMAYAFAWVPFPGKGVLLVLVAALFVPEGMRLLPNFMLEAKSEAGLLQAVLSPWPQLLMAGSVLVIMPKRRHIVSGLIRGALTREK